jgi:uncharacterized Zn-finger protein
MAADEWLLVDDREVVITPEMYVHCNGGDGGGGHPYSSITLEHGLEAVCKYCGRRWVNAANPEAGELRARGRPYPAMAAGEPPATAAR